MKYKITHTTKYNYDAPVPVCHNVVYLTPRNTEVQTCSRHRLTVNPSPTTNSKRIDYFGNAVSTFSIATSHKLLQITASSSVTVEPRELPAEGNTQSWEVVRDALVTDHSAEGLATYQFAFPSPHVPLHPELGDYARESFTPGCPILEAVRSLNDTTPCGHKLRSEGDYGQHADHGGL